MKIFVSLILFLFLTACGIDKEGSAPLSSIAGGDLDTSFSDDGYFTHHNAAAGTNHDEGYAVTVDSTGRVIIVGSSINGSSNTDMVVWVLTEDGVLDTSFSGDGIFVYDGGNGNDAAYGVVTDSANNIYVTGFSVNGSANFDMAVWKLTPSGVLDTSFDGDGVFIHDGAAGGNIHDQGNDIIIDASNNLYVTGYSDQTASNRDMAIWKLNSAGALVTAFDTDGIVTSDGVGGGEDDIGYDIKLSSAGNIYVAGRADSASNSADMAVWAFNSSGAALTSFSGTGSFTHNNAAGGNAFDAATGLALDSVGDIYVTGYSRNSSNNNDMVVWKLSSAGTLDASFDSDGIFVFDITAAVGASTSDSGEDIAIDNSGNIIVSGSGNADAAMWRLSSTGVLDTSFNGDGSFFHDSAASGFATDAGSGMYYDSTADKIYMTGYSENASGNFDMAVWRLQ